MPTTDNNVSFKHPLLLVKQGINIIKFELYHVDNIMRNVQLIRGNITNSSYKNTPYIITVNVVAAPNYH